MSLSTQCPSSMQLLGYFVCFKNIYYVDRLQSPSAGSTFAPIADPAASARTVSATAHSTVRISAAAGPGGRPALQQRVAAGPWVGSASGAGRAADGGSAGGGQWVGGKRRCWPPSAHQSPFPPPLGRCIAVPECSARAGAESCAAAALRLRRDHRPQRARCCLRMQLHAPPPPAPPRRRTVSSSATSAVPNPARPATTAAANAHTVSPASGGGHRDGDGMRT
jgi:hypothetical protein